MLQMIDWVIIGLYFLLSAAIGFHYTRRAGSSVQEFFLSGRNLPWWLAGTFYGFGLYLVMNGLVLPLRFGAPFPPADLVKGLVALFPHIVFIGLPLAWLTRKDTV